MKAKVPEALRVAAERLPRALRSWLAPRLAAPVGFVSPSPAPLGRVRWLLLAGRRPELVWRTLLLPETPEGDARLAARLGLAVRRAVRLGRGSGAFES